MYLGQISGKDCLLDNSANPRDKLTLFKVMEVQLKAFTTCERIEGEFNSNPICIIAADRKQRPCIISLSFIV